MDAAVIPARGLVSVLCGRTPLARRDKTNVACLRESYRLTLLSSAALAPGGSSLRQCNVLSALRMPLSSPRFPPTGDVNKISIGSKTNIQVS